MRSAGVAFHGVPPHARVAAPLHGPVVDLVVLGGIPLVPGVVLATAETPLPLLWRLGRSQWRKGTCRERLLVDQANLGPLWVEYLERSACPSARTWHCLTA